MIGSLRIQNFKSIRDLAIQPKRVNLFTGDLHADVNQRIPNWTRLLNELVRLNSPRLLRLKALLLESQSNPKPKL